MMQVSSPLGTVGYPEKIHVLGVGVLMVEFHIAINLNQFRSDLTLYVPLFQNYCLTLHLKTYYPTELFVSAHFVRN